MNNLSTSEKGNKKNKNNDWLNSNKEKLEKKNEKRKKYGSPATDQPSRLNEKRLKNNEMDFKGRAVFRITLGLDRSFIHAL